MRLSDIRLDPDAAAREVGQLTRAADERVFDSVRNRPPSPVTTALRTRRDQRDFSTAEQDAFRGAVSLLVERGIYQSLVHEHMDMRHNMHGAMHGALNPRGLLRFLPWHRRYLLAFEEHLREADRERRPGAEEELSLPYWRWTDSFPSWLEGFLPAPDPETGGPPPARVFHGDVDRPSQEDVRVIVEGFRTQLSGRDVDDYLRFTWGLEGWGQRPDASPLPAHNHVHDWIGGIMGNPMSSPADPVFWLHHAEVDRLWHVWQRAHPAAAPALSGSAAVMDPWTEIYADVHAIDSLGYSYARVEP